MLKPNPQIEMKVTWENEEALAAPFRVLVSLCKRLHGEDELVVQSVVETAHGWLVGLTKNGRTICDKNTQNPTAFDWHILRPL